MVKENSPAIADMIGNDEALRDITSMEDALALLHGSGVVAQDVTDFGTGFNVVDKATLVGVPFVALGYRRTIGDHGPMVVIFAVTKGNEKAIIVDGSTGIREQLDKFEAAGLVPGGAFKCERGLTRSDYKYKDRETGEEKPATTYYLSA